MFTRRRPSKTRNESLGDLAPTPKAAVARLPSDTVATESAGCNECRLGGARGGQHERPLVLEQPISVEPEHVLVAGGEDERRRLEAHLIDEVHRVALRVEPEDV